MPLVSYEASLCIGEGKNELEASGGTLVFLLAALGLQDVA